MIQNTIQTKASHEIEISIWGKAETKELIGIPKEELSESIRKLVAKKIGVATNKVFLLEQIHGDKFYNTNTLSELRHTEGDALYTSQVGDVLVVKTADCMPLFFWSDSERLIGVIHSGWKGADLGISEKLFLHIRSEGYSLESIHAYLGPCIRKKNYEVGEDLYKIFKAYSLDAIEAKGNNKYLLGLNVVLQKRLLENKIPIHFSDSEICTLDDSQFHSHRRGDKGRNLNLIYMK